MNWFIRLRWFWLALAVFGADQFTKFLIEQYTNREFSFVVIPGLVNLVHAHNPGVAFGLLADVQSPWISGVLVGFSTAVMILLVLLLISGHAGGTVGRVGVTFILGGAAGNVFDRLTRHSVTDFIDVHWRASHWPAFNVADSAIVIGAALVIMELIRDRRHMAHSHH